MRKMAVLAQCTLLIALWGTLLAHYSSAEENATGADVDSSAANQSAEETLAKVNELNKRLLITTVAVVAVIAVYIAFSHRLGVLFSNMLLSFMLGCLGNILFSFTNINDFTNLQLEALNTDWQTFATHTIFGGLAAVFLYIFFATGLVEGHMFPSFTKVDDPQFFADTWLGINPEKGQDYALVSFWSLAAGFSQDGVTKLIGHIAKAINEMAH